MAENSAISWTNDTFNPWEGCQKVGPGCDGCYAEARNHRWAPKGSTSAPNWGPGAPRRRTSASNWREPLKWEREQAALWAEYDRTVGPCDSFNGDSRPDRPEPAPRFVFCASLADVFDNAVPMEWRSDLFELIHKTPHLTWLLLTKRPSMIERLFFKSAASQGWPRNAAIGCTVVNQEEADRDIPTLLAAKAALEPAFAFLSMEPLLGPVNLDRLHGSRDLPGGGDEHWWESCLNGKRFDIWSDGDVPAPKVDWVITGGETDQGHHRARPAHPDWFRSLRDQCAAAGVPYHHKQNGAWAACQAGDGEWPVDQGSFIRLTAGGERTEEGWPMQKVGHRFAGRLLDGQEHNDRPEVARG